MCGINCGCDDCIRSLEVLKANDGRDGLNGLSVLFGNGVPANTSGQDGQVYIDLTSPKNMWVKISGAWSNAGRLQGLDGNGFFLKTTTFVTGSQVLLLNTNPIPLLTLPSSSFAVELYGAVAKYTFNSTQYSVSNNPMQIRYANGTVAASIPADMIQSSVNAYQKFVPITPSPILPV